MGKSGLVVAFALACSACAAQNDQTDRQAWAQQQNEANEQQRAAQRQRDQLAATQQAEAAAAEVHRQEQARADAAADEKAKIHLECDGTRETRAADAKGRAQRWLDFVRRVGPKAKWITTNCKIADTRGLHVEHQRDATGVTIRTRAVGREDGVECKGGIPKGLSEDDVRNGLATEDDGINADSPYADNNLRCQADDDAVGLDILVGYGDLDGLKKLLAWKPAAP